MDSNREHWDEATDIHARGDVYGIEAFKAGRCQLHRIEVEELGDVVGKTLLHLQCHFGLGTLSWARRGAIVTGVDFSHMPPSETTPYSSWASCLTLRGSLMLVLALRKREKAILWMNRTTDGSL